MMQTNSIELGLPIFMKFTDYHDIKYFADYLSEMASLQADKPIDFKGVEVGLLDDFHHYLGIFFLERDKKYWTTKRINIAADEAGFEIVGE